VLQEFMDACSGMKNLGDVIRSLTEAQESQAAELEKLTLDCAANTTDFETIDTRIRAAENVRSTFGARARRLERAIGLPPYVAYGQNNASLEGEASAPSFSEKQREAFKKAFLPFDKEGDGSIMSQDLGNVMRTLGQTPTDEMLQDFVEEVDHDGSGYIEFSEFCQLMLHCAQEAEWNSEAAKLATTSLSLLARQRHALDLITLHSSELQQHSTLIDESAFRIDEVNQRMEVVEVDAAETRLNMQQVSQGLDLSREYWKGLSNGLKETKDKVVTKEGEGEMLAGTKQLRSALPPLSRPSPKVCNLTAR